MAEKGAIEGGNHAALWHGRFTEGPNAAAVEFETSIHVDERMVFDDIVGSQAHVRMLGRTGIIAQHEAEAIILELDQISSDLKEGRLRIDFSAEDIHSFLESVLTDRLGEIGKKVHTGRSRNDQIALDERLYLRHAVPDLQNRILSLIEVLTDIATHHRDTLISGYTHLQRAQPVTLAHHLCAWAWMLQRDYERLADSLKRISFCPLGAGALATSGLPLDRYMVATDLEFCAPTANSLDTVADRDYCIEITAALALLMTHLSRFCEEVIIWSTEEFKYIELSEKWSTGSSIMPQKKNPDFAELIRGRAGLVYGNLMALLTMMKGLPLSYNRDMQEDKNSLFSAYDTALSCVIVFTEMIGSARWNTDRMALSCSGGYANATDVADYLVRKGISFRTAHGVAAAIVRKCIEKGYPDIEKMPLAELRNCSPLIEADLLELLTPSACVENRNHPGGPAYDRTLIQINELKAFCGAARKCIEKYL